MSIDALRGQRSYRPCPQHYKSNIGVLLKQVPSAIATALASAPAGEKVKLYYVLALVSPETRQGETGTATLHHLGLCSNLWFGQMWTRKAFRHNGRPARSPF